jgi:serine/threonine-protein phosphatase 6 regulatory subunit 3
VSACHILTAFYRIKIQRYPHVATEVLCSEIWSIVETCVNHQDQLLTPFWETVLDTPPDEMKTRMVMAGNFAKVNAVFMTKKPAEVSVLFFFC